MKTLIVLLILAVFGVLWLCDENDKLSQSLEGANRVTNEQKSTINMLKNQLSVAANRADKNERAQVSLRQQLDSAGKLAAQREQTITRLLNENETFRRWYRTDLPDVVHRMHRRPACTSASHCLQRMSESQPLPDARQRPEN
ncbi:Rz-like lysis system protein LysB [Yersinia kristensenii]|uniref:Rz-like lysis system protein LysB n=1 Tax=Yersinia kristensenii TaxID=28152 RepID=UPI0005E7AB02|nr:Rz-like lysis system protein LysB [Yersinia kristensenii]CNL09212.1 phage lysin [Yersinia kristensenii]